MDGFRCGNHIEAGERPVSPFNYFVLSTESYFVTLHKLWKHKTQKGQEKLPKYWNLNRSFKGKLLVRTKEGLWFETSPFFYFANCSFRRYFQFFLGFTIQSLIYKICSLKSIALFLFKGNGQTSVQIFSREIPPTAAPVLPTNLSQKRALELKVAEHSLGLISGI